MEEQQCTKKTWRNNYAEINVEEQECRNKRGGTRVEEKTWRNNYPGTNVEEQECRHKHGEATIQDKHGGTGVQEQV